MSIEKNHLEDLYRQASAESEVTLMSHNFKLAVVNELNRLGKAELAEQVENQNFELEEKKFIARGEESKKANPDFDIEEYLNIRVHKFIEELENNFKN